MADLLQVNIDGQVVDTGSTPSEVLDKISRRALSVELSEDKISYQSLTADDVTEANATIGVTLPAVVLVVNRDPSNILLIGPAVTGPALQRFIKVMPTTSWPIALFVLDDTVTLRYKSLGAPVNFFLRAWPISNP